MLGRGGGCALRQMMDPEDMEMLVRHLALQVKQMEEGMLRSGQWVRTAVAEGYRWDAVISTHTMLPHASTPYVFDPEKKCYVPR